MNLTKEDLLLIEKAREAIKANYDGVTFKHTVGCALRTKSGKISLVSMFILFMVLAAKLLQLVTQSQMAKENSTLSLLWQVITTTM